MRDGAVYLSGDSSSANISYESSFFDRAKARHTTPHTTIDSAPVKIVNASDAQRNVVVVRKNQLAAIMRI